MKLSQQAASDNAISPVPSASESDVVNTRRPLSEAEHLPGKFYSEPAILELEKERIFFDDWLMVARADQLAVPGDYLTFRVLGEPFIVARDKAERLNAFSSRCAHRGVAVASEPGRSSRFVCPYHGWTYDLTGRLLAASFMDHAVDFDKTKCRLKPLHIGEWGGWVFVNFSPDPIPFEQWIKPYERHLGFLRQELCTHADTYVFEVPCNWKLPAENLVDNYHGPILHQKTFGTFISPERDRAARHGFRAFNVFFKGPSLTADKQTRFGPMPWLMSHDPQNFVLSAMLAPNAHLFARSDHFVMFSFWPLTVTRTRVDVHHLFAKELVADPAFREKVSAYSEFTRVFLAEDISVFAGLQDAAQSSRVRPGRMSTQEEGIWNMANHYLDRVLGSGGRQLYTD